MFKIYKIKKHDHISSNNTNKYSKIFTAVIFFSFFNIQCLPGSSQIHTTTNCSNNFSRVDQIFNTLGLPENIKISIFQLLASILHLGNIEFKDTNDDQAQILEPFERNVEFASKLLNLTSEELKAALLFKWIKDNKSEIS